METYAEMMRRKQDDMKVFMKWRNNLENLSEKDLRNFIRFTHRAECDRDSTVYIKAIRATLISLGYPEEFVNGELYELLLEEYE